MSWDFGFNLTRVAKADVFTSSLLLDELNIGKNRGASIMELHFL